MFFLFIYGAVVSACQILFTRKLISVFQGNEAIYGVVFSFWLLFTALGISAFPTKRILPQRGPLLLPVLPILCLFEILCIEPIMAWAKWNMGETISLAPVLVFSILLLLPFCFFSGYLFRCAVLHARETSGFSLGKAYAWESGGMAAGAAFSYFFLLFFPQNLQLIPFGVMLAFVPLFLSSKIEKNVLFVLGFTLLLLCAWAQWRLPDSINYCESLRFGKGVIRFSEDTPYGQIRLLKNRNTSSLYLNQSLLATEQDTYHAEELLLGALPHLRSDSARMFVASFQWPQMLPALNARAGIKNADVVFWSEGLRNAVFQALHPTESPNFPVTDLLGDPLNVLIRSGSAYDAILWDLPNSGSLQMNRYFTQECFTWIRKKLQPEGVFVFTAQASEDFVGPSMAGALGSLHATLGAVFNNHLVLPGEQWVFIARNGSGTLWNDPDSLLGKIGPTGSRFRFMNRGYLPFRLSNQRIQLAEEILSRQSWPVNHFFSPVVYSGFFRLWSSGHFPWLKKAVEDLSVFPKKIFFLISFIAGCLLFLICRLSALNPFAFPKDNLNRSRLTSLPFRLSRFWATKPNPVAPVLSLFFLSFSVMSLQWLFLAGFQVAVGNLYSFYAIALCVFMAAIAIGAFTGIQARPSRNWIVLFHGFLLACCLIFSQGIQVGGWLSHPFWIGTLFLSGIFALGFLLGFAFPVLSAHSSQTGKLWIYSADLAGGCLGALIISLLFFPALGFAGSLKLIACVNLIPFAGTGWK